MIIKKSGGTAARDPFVTFHAGAFYHCFTENDAICVAKADTVAGLPDAAAKTVFVPEAGKPWSCELWAPELHIIDGKCYIYVACDDGDNNNHRMYVLANDSADPQAPYRMGGKITDATDKWAIDATVLHHKGRMYMVWSGWEGDENISQRIYIARMADPFTVDSQRYELSRPEYDWEVKGAGIGAPTVNEGPCALVRGDKVYILYSASGSWCNDYCLGLLELTGEDVLDKNAWKKHPKPVFSRTDAVKGPGHCSVVSDEKGGDWLFYHAFDEDERFGWNSCSAHAQKFAWDGDFPVFGKPEE